MYFWAKFFPKIAFILGSLCAIKLFMGQKCANFYGKLRKHLKISLPHKKKLDIDLLTRWPDRSETVIKWLNNHYKLIISARGKLFFMKSKFFLEKMSSFLVKLHLLLWKFCPKIAYILGPLCAIGPKMLQFLQHYGIKITYVNI